MRQIIGAGLLAALLSTTALADTSSMSTTATGMGVLENDYIKQVSEISFEDEIANLEEVFAITKEKAVEVDFSLERTVIAELKRAQNSINKIKKKVTKAEKKKHEVAINRIDSIKEAFFPGGTFQERKLNILEFYQPDLIKNLIQDLNSLEDNLTLLEVQNQ